ncbi:U6 snRNA phosphodiesterase isoform X2 [Pelobates cultripes]|uniref:U6 snRNA phosphodiesterase 1 n=1 Tax=Pelobates cultripes TaxID=61616 RepID=A0AAD1WV90_PELCU|nr:U6 snRNA phosphodiesterase isoform X2 [Pelobates cultripes]
MGTFHSCWDVQPQEEFLDLLDEVISILKKHDIILNKMNEFHISQSQTVVLRHHWINLFVQSLRDRLSSMHRFLCIAEQLHVYTNSEKTRTFLGLEISVGKEQLLDVVAEVDQSLKEFNLQTFYQDPSFHVSLAWCVGDTAWKIGGCLKELQTVLDGFENAERLTRFYADEIRCKAGNKSFRVQLKQ